jgi:copper chaperone CopZ
MKLTVKDMSCNHCVMTIQKALLVSGIQGKVELSDKSVTILKDSDVDHAKEVIKKAGYTVL